MKIHITEERQSLLDIAKLYGVDEEIIRNINDLKYGEPAVGEELLIIIPTRIYQIQYGDSIDRIAMRFEISKRDLLLANPHLCTREPAVGEKIILRTAERTHGMRVANGYFYKGCSEEGLNRVLPYLTYVTFASALADFSGVKKIFDDQRLVKKVVNEGKIPLIRVYDQHIERYKKGDDQTAFADGLIKIAKEGEYKGIILNSSAFSHSAKEFVEFLMILRKRMIGCDLILITEADEKTPKEFCEYADGGLLYYPKYAMDDPAPFADGERKLLSDFACNSESAKTFVDIPALAMMNNKYISISEATELARSGKYEIVQDKNTLLSHIKNRGQDVCRFLSLKGLEKILELVGEFDFMGVCFDIMRTPLQHLLMYNSLFKSSYSTNVRSREGCSRGVEE